MWTHYFFNATTGVLIDTDTYGIPGQADGNAREPNTSDHYYIVSIGGRKGLFLTGLLQTKVNRNRAFTWSGLWER